MDKQEMELNNSHFYDDKILEKLGLVEKELKAIKDICLDLLSKNLLPFHPLLLYKVDKLNASVRTSNCLRNENHHYLIDLLQCSEWSLLRTANFGRKCLTELNDLLKELTKNKFSIGKNPYHIPVLDMEKMLNLFDPEKISEYHFDNIDPEKLSLSPCRISKELFEEIKRDGRRTKYKATTYFPLMGMD